MYLSAFQVGTAKNGLFDWQTWAPKARKLYDMGENHMPWTDRCNVFVQGASKQLSRHNFMHELLNIRWKALCVARGLEDDTDQVGVDDAADVRQNNARQIKDGSVCLLTGSLVYNYRLDRTLCPKEHLRLQGWGNDINTSMLAVPVDGLSASSMPPSRVHPDARKRRKKAVRQVPCPNVKIVEMAGNMMCLPDVTSVFYAAMMAVPTGVFQNGPPALARARALLSNAPIPLDPFFDVSSDPIGFEAAESSNGEGEDVHLLEDV